MVRAPSVDSSGMKKGAWSEEEDNKLRAYIQRYGHWNWRLVPKYAGLARCGKSCRLRWVNYLKPGVKKGNFTKREEDLIVQLHAKLGNKWAAISKELSGRTDNEIKNFYHTRIEKRRTRSRASKNVNDEHINEADRELEEETKPASDQVTNPSSSIKDFQMDFWNNFHDAFDLSNYTQNHDYISSVPLPEQEVLYAQAHQYTELDWIADDGHSHNSSDYVAQMQQENLWTESFSSNNANSQSGISCYFSQEEVGSSAAFDGVSDPFLQYFDHGMDLFR